jgi:transcriptional regulator with XRE-family HTH domain
LGGDVYSGERCDYTRSKDVPTEDNEMLSLGAAIAKRREELGLSQRDLALRAELSNATLSFIEKGTTEQPKPSTLSKIATALGMSIDDLYSMAGILPARKPSTKLDRIMSKLANILAEMPEHGWDEVLKYAQEKHAEEESDIEKKRRTKSG